MEGVRLRVFFVFAVLFCFEGFVANAAATKIRFAQGESLAIIHESELVKNGIELRALLQDEQSSETSAPLSEDDVERLAQELAVAASSSDDEAISQLLKAGLDPDATTSVGTPALWRAAFNNHPSTVVVLLNAGAWIDGTNANGTTSLYAAAQNGNIDVVRLLIERGADVDKSSVWGSTPLVVAAQEGFAEVCAALLTAGAKPDLVKDSSGQGALWSASFGGFDDVVKVLLEHGADLDLVDKTLTSPLYAAAQNNHTEVVVSLLGAGADPDLARRDGNAPLHTASAHCFIPIVQLLVEAGADRSSQNRDGARAVQVACREANAWQGNQQPVEDILAPLIKAARRGETQKCRDFIAQGEFVDEKLWDGWTALHAASLADEDVVKVLLKAGADVNAQESLNRTAVYTGSIYGDVAIIKALVEGGADVNLRDTSGRIPLHVAAEEGHPGIVTFLLENGSMKNAVDKDRRTTVHISVCGRNPSAKVLTALKPSRSRVNAKDRFGKTAMHCAAEMGNVRIVATLATLKADVNARDSLGRTALHLAAMADHAAAVDEILKIGGDQTLVDNRGRHPSDLVGEGGVPTTDNGKLIVQLLLADTIGRMVAAAWRGDKDEVSSYLMMGTDVNGAVSNGTTTLHVATQQGDLDLLRILLDAGANLEASDEQGQTPLHLAAKYGRSEVLTFFAGKQINLETKDWNGQHPLHVAAASSESDVKTLEGLLKLGAEVNAKDDVGMTPLHTAVQNNRLDLTRALVGMGADKGSTDNKGREPMDLVADSVRGKRRKQFESLLKISESDGTGKDVGTGDSFEILSQPSEIQGDIHGRAATRKLSKSTTVFMVLMPVVFMSVLIVMITMAVKRFNTKGGHVGRSSWSFKSRRVETPSTILTELYIPSEGSMRSSFTALRSPRQVGFKNPYYCDRDTNSNEETTTTETGEGGDQESVVAQKALAPDVFQKWIIANANAPPSTGSMEKRPPESARLPQRRAISFPEEDTGKESNMDHKAMLKSKSERLHVAPRMVPHPLHNRRIDVRRLMVDGRYPTVSFDMTSQFSSQSFQSMQMNSLYFTASSNDISGRQLSRDSLGLVDDLWYTGADEIQGIPEESDRHFSGKSTHTDIHLSSEMTGLVLREELDSARPLPSSDHGEEGKGSEALAKANGGGENLEIAAEEVDVSPRDSCRNTPTPKEDGESLQSGKTS